MYRSKDNKNIWVMILVLLAGIIVGGFLGEVITNATESVQALSFLKALSYSKDFGLSSFGFDLGIIVFALDFTIRFSVWGVIGMVCAYFIYKKI